MSALDDAPLSAGNPVLFAALVDRIHASGPIPFDEFMDLALYASPGGYYERDAAGIGRQRADYYTAPEASPAFSDLLATQVFECLDRVAASGPLDIVELGAGCGTMAGGLVEALARRRPDLHARCVYWIVERSAALRARQRARLAPLGHEDKIQWAQKPESIRLGGIRGCVVANEFYDALPVRVVARRGRRLFERRVGLTSDESGLTWVEVEASDPRLVSYAERYGLASTDGAVAEAGIAAQDYASRVARSLGRGYQIVIDYGDRADRLYDTRARPFGTLMGYSEHRTSGDPFLRVGMQDLTAHVNFSAIEDASAEEGLRTAGFTTQHRFLVALGLAERIADLAGASDPAAIDERISMMSLIHPEGMGGIFRVLVQGKDLSDATLQGLRDPFARSAHPSSEGPSAEETSADVRAVHRDGVGGQDIASWPGEGP